MKKNTGRADRRRLSKSNRTKLSRKKQAINERKLFRMSKAKELIL